MTAAATAGSRTQSQPGICRRCHGCRLKWPVTAAAKPGEPCWPRRRRDRRTDRRTDGQTYGQTIRQLGGVPCRCAGPRPHQTALCLTRRQEALEVQLPMQGRTSGANVPRQPPCLRALHTDATNNSDTIRNCDELSSSPRHQLSASPLTSEIGNRQQLPVILSQLINPRKVPPSSPSEFRLSNTTVSKANSLCKPPDS